ncbi:phosphonate ABC transporter substrate-binding protein [Thioalkalivibrio versutus]|uniref:Phosphonate ABC transporter substrate-binding protein n=1 Tax=Thioalkalivibrio versutus TaxID=106634 RepID=A0A0G3G791_9GAMM|nr:PhnD/SsuA/transferrin family substrate-binding protein [Thioalkalivibrio versutus]AKJ96244.1 phosphonate ABC transporter substrate-binding protein [Thioalkalivibrio versutus]
MNNRMTQGLLGGVLGLLLPLTAQATADDELVFGSVAMDIPAQMLSRLEPFTEYLAGTLERDVNLRLSSSMPDAIREIVEGRSDIAYLTPVAYIRANQRGGVEPLARTITKGEDSFRLMIVVAEDSPLQSPEELAGKRFAFGDEAALLQRAAVVDSGIELADLGAYHFLGHYDNIVRGVISGDFDAGILKDTAAYRWEGNGIRILHASPALPPYVIAARAGLDPALQDRIRAALLTASPDDPASGPAMRALDENYDGFAPVSDADYDVVRGLIAPFD